MITELYLDSMIKNLVREKFQNPEFIESLEDGINDSIIFDVDGDRYVAKYFTDGAIETRDYLGAIKLASDYVTNTSSFQTPDIHSFGTFKGTAFVIYEYIDGVPLRSEVINSKNEQEKYLSLIGEVIGELHTLKNPSVDFGWYTLDEDNEIVLKNGYETMNGMMMSFLDYNLNQLNRELSSKEEDKIRTTLSNSIEYTGDSCIGHCDVKYNNFIESDHNLWLIDWEFPRSIDPLYEYVKTERQVIRRYDYTQSMEREEVDDLINVFRNSYFESSPRSFDRLQYECYWIQEMIECMRACENWYDSDDLPDVKSYYKSEVMDSIDKLDRF